MVTPEWAKRKWPSADGPGTAPQLGGPPTDGLPTAGRPLNRGPVARRLNIDQVRGQPFTRGCFLPSLPGQLGSRLRGI